MHKILRHGKRVGIAIGGGLVVVAGIIMIPYPGPGWLVVFAGLGILATEFAWARRVLDYAKMKYDLWNVWLKRQNALVQIGVGLVTLLVVIVTIWLINGYGFIEHFFNLHQRWLDSPFL